MNVLRQTVVALLSLVALVSLASADDEELRQPRCSKCKHTGLVACKEHKKSDVAHEHNALYCSEFADCEVCAGVGLFDCEGCNNEVAQKWLEERRAGQARFAEELAELDTEMGRKLVKARSEHFVLVWDVEQMKVGKKRLKQHELLHLYLDRLERLFDDYLELMQAGEAEFAQPARVFVWWLLRDQEEASLRFCNNMGRTGVKLMGSSINYSVLARAPAAGGGTPGTASGGQELDKDEFLHRNLIHNVTHLLLSHQTPSRWIGNIKGGWADAGLAHFFEERYFGVCDNYCYQEVNSNRDFKGGKWKPEVRKMAARKDHPPVAEVFAQNTNTLTLEQHALSFSYVDFLLQRDGEAFSTLCRRLRGKTPTRDALKETFGWTPFEFEEEWRAWVLATYPTR